MNPLQKLDRHDIIAVDFDGTLVDNPGSIHLWKYIRDNHERKQFHIVTFRFKHDADHCLPILNLLSKRTGIAPTAEMFRSVEYRPVLNESDSYDNLPQEFKALVCKRIGATVIIDDLVDVIGEHCDRHGVEVVDALALMDIIEA